MKTILLSLKPEVFQNVQSGKKIYEHRRVFPNEPVKAYIYISRPIQALAGIMYLGNKVYIEEWKEKYKEDIDVQSRIENYLKHHKVAMEIQRFQNTSLIELKEIKKDFPKFLIPQMYYYLDDHPLLQYLENNLVPIGEPITHTFENIKSEQICVY
ncbi:hypothetical protein MX111_00040 [Streptococcus uberis]|uniref:hypothetical protein n=1 Tax=Streptococcus uberis TaxID=1349 RepID=UPI0027DE6BF9|nr:hypothetical protein [Streptococcus uberis]MCK1237869.1 hypothetical protein [Streptococcus uberis]